MAPRRFPIGAILGSAVALGIILLIGLNLLPTVSGFSAGPTGPLTRGATAPDFQVTSLDGRRFRLSDARGRVVAMYFAAAWCPTCVYEAQAWTALHQRYRDRGLEVVMVDVDSTEGVAQWDAFRQRTGGGSQLWVLDPGLQIASAYGVTSLETSIIIDRQGRVAFNHGATVSLDQLQREVESLL